MQINYWIYISETAAIAQPFFLCQLRPFVSIPVAVASA
jgi:hypothetical protein